MTSVDSPTLEPSPLSTRRRRASCAGLWTLVDQALLSGASFLAALAVGRSLGDTGLGLYYLGFPVIVLLITLLTCLISLPFAIRLQAMPPERRAVWLGAALLGQFLVLGFVVLALGLATLLIWRMQGADAGRLALSVSAAVVGNWLREFTRRLLLADFRALGAVLIDGVVAVLLLAQLLWLHHSNAIDVPRVFWAIAWAHGAAALLGFVLARGHATFDRKQLKSDWKAGWELGRGILSAAMLSVVQGWSIPWIIPAVSSIEVGGRFSQCLLIPLLINPISMGLAAFLSPFYARTKHVDGQQKLHRLVAWHTGLLGILLLIVIAAVAWQGVPFVEMAFNTKANHLAWGTLLALTIAHATQRLFLLPLENLILVEERTDIILKSGFVAMVATLIGVVLATPYFSELGAAVAVLVAMFLGESVKILLGLRMMRLCVREAAATSQLVTNDSARSEQDAALVTTERRENHRPASLTTAAVSPLVAPTIAPQANSSEAVYQPFMQATDVEGSSEGVNRLGEEPNVLVNPQTLPTASIASSNRIQSAAAVHSDKDKRFSSPDLSSSSSSRRRAQFAPRVLSDPEADRKFTELVDRARAKRLNLLVFCIWVAVIATFSPPQRDLDVATGSLDLVGKIKVVCRLGTMALMALMVLDRQSWRLNGWLQSIFLSMVLYLIWGFASVSWSPMPSVSLGQIISFTVAAGFAYVTACNVRSERDLSKVLMHFAMSSTFVCTALLATHYGAPSIGRFSRSLETGFMHPTSIASTAAVAFLTMLIATVVFRCKWALRCWMFAMPIQLVTLYAAENRMSVAALVPVTGCVLLLFAPRKQVLIIAGAGALILFCYLMVDPGLSLVDAVLGETSAFASRGQTSDEVGTFSGRYEMWAAQLESFSESPITGHGYFVTSSEGMLYVWYTLANWTAHNVWLQIAVTTGVVGLGLFSWAMVTWTITIVRAKRNNPLHPQLAAALFWVALWFLAWSSINESIAGPFQPETVGFFLLLGVGLASAVPARNEATNQSESLSSVESSRLALLSGGRVVQKATVGDRLSSPIRRGRS